MGLVKKLILGGTAYGVAREFNKRRDRDSEGQTRQPAPEPYPPQHSQQQYYHPPPPPASQHQQHQQQQYQQGPPAYEQYQPAPSNYQPRQNWDEKR
ncbi:hypothetical protein ISF_00721 [Cordyceps fumosorosea ARSEF 2679]|uniref:Uncharacterized protein n=1 Tax=Cordyceps fumosorosea (strain ARSEF 2679) TaxID=1081104 RepID=A0A168EHS4_CORFA|nr:hypothetical protein ISF_00721 [Cordyceps fumosorosea ARSEF 2679]OAA73820.1 hypothetical protein ISF_00721 [Cordyceps fumosorosea ARSEF 2679]